MSENKSNNAELVEEHCSELWNEIKDALVLDASDISDSFLGRLHSKGARLDAEVRHLADQSGAQLAMGAQLRLCSVMAAMGELERKKSASRRRGTAPDEDSESDGHQLLAQFRKWLQCTEAELARIKARIPRSQNNAESLRDLELEQATLQEQIETEGRARHQQLCSQQQKAATGKEGRLCETLEHRYLALWLASLESKELISHFAARLRKVAALRAQLQQSTASCSAKSLPECELSRAIELHLANFLAEQSIEIEVAIRVLSSSAKTVAVKSKMLKWFGANLPKAFPYTCKAIFAFLVRSDAKSGKSEEICTLGFFVHEFYEKCAPPNKRRIYLAYLDSVRFIEPSKLRSTIYQQVLLGYLRYAKKIGFAVLHFWASPPQQDDFYIFNGRPIAQKVPTPDLLRKWYLDVLEKGMEAGIVSGWQDLHSYAEQHVHTPSELPYFEGDHWPKFLERAIAEARGTKKGGRKVAIARNFERTVTESLEQELRETRDHFFVVRLCSEEEEEVMEVEGRAIEDPDELAECAMVATRKDFLSACIAKG